MHRILFVTYGDLSHASSRIRALEYKNRFENEGWATYWVKRRPFSNPGLPLVIQAFRVFIYKRTFTFRFFLHLFQLISNAKSPVDNESRLFIYFQKEFLKPIWLGIVTKLKRVQIVYDIDDAIHLEMNQRERRAFKHFLNTCDVLICSTTYLSRSLLQEIDITSRYIILPTPVNTKFEQGVSMLETPYVLGWIGSPSTQNNLDLVFEALRGYEFSNIMVELCGVNDIVIPTELEGLVCTRKWSLENQDLLLSRMDYGLAPLKDSDWNQQKGGYKINLYSANGKPTLGSPVGVNLDMMKSMGSYICSDISEWRKTLKMLDKHELRAEYYKKATGAFEYASKNMSYSVTYRLLKSQLETMESEYYDGNE